VSERRPPAAVRRFVQAGWVACALTAALDLLRAEEGHTATRSPHPEEQMLRCVMMAVRNPASYRPCLTSSKAPRRSRRAFFQAAFVRLRSPQWLSRIDWLCL